MVAHQIITLYTIRCFITTNDSACSLSLYGEIALSMHSGKSGTIQELNLASGVGKAHYAYYYHVRKNNSIKFAGTGLRKKSTLASGSSHTKIHSFDYPKRFINRINNVHYFFN